MSRQIGWWASHEYHRRKVEDIKRFVGWNYLVEQNERIAAKHGYEKAALQAALMEGGFRIGEAVASSDGKRFGGLLRSNVVVQEKRGIVIFRDVLRLKGYKKTGAYYETRTDEELQAVSPSLQKLFIKDDRSGLFIRKRFRTKSVQEYRTFPVLLSEPLVKPFLDYWRETEAPVLFPFTATRAYQILKGIDAEVWNHWYRAQRASQLGAEYEWDPHQLKLFFKWKDQKTAERYARSDVRDILKMYPRPGDFARIWGDEDLLRQPEPPETDSYV